MFKRIAIVIVLFALAAAPALAAPVAGKVASVAGTTVQITLEGELASWVKKGVAVKIKGGPGKVVEVSGSTVTVTTTKASELKAGDAVSFDKRSMSGC